MTLTQLVAVLAGGKISYELAGVVPPLPVDNFILSHLHQGIPLYITAALVFLEDNVTGRVMAASLYDRVASRLKRRVFAYGRKGTVDTDG